MKKINPNNSIECHTDRTNTVNLAWLMEFYCTKGKFCMKEYDRDNYKFNKKYLNIALLKAFPAPHNIWMPAAIWTEKVFFPVL